MDSRFLAKQTAAVVMSYLTYQAMRQVVGQLREMNPGKAVWLSGFSSAGKLQDGEAYLQELMAADRELALRIMTVREHIADEIVDYLPEMTRAGLQQANMEHRRQMLERLTQVVSQEEPDSALPPDEPSVS